MPDDNKLVNALISLLIETLEEKAGFTLIKFRDTLLLEAIADYFEHHETITDDIRKRTVKSLRNVVRRGTQITKDQWELMEEASEYWNKHVRDQIASEEHWLGKCY